MVDLTVLILTKNEEQNLPKAIASLGGIAARVVVVDSCSDDATAQIATDLGCDVYNHEWCGYSAQFNWGLDNTGISTVWVMRLDADEELSTELVSEIAEKLPGMDLGVSGINLKRRVYFMGRWIRHGGYYPTWLLRIFRTGCGRCEDKVMDEHIILESGRAIDFRTDVIDRNNKPLTWWIQKHNWYSDRDAYEVLHQDELRASGKLLAARWAGNRNERKRWLKERLYLRLPPGFRAWAYFFYRYYLKLGFLDGPQGLIFHFLQAYWYRFLVDAKIYECRKFGDAGRPSAFRVGD